MTRVMQGVTGEPELSPYTTYHLNSLVEGWGSMEGRTGIPICSYLTE